MPDFYYVDLYFDPDEHSLREIVDGCVSAITSTGGTYVKAVMAKPDTKQQVNLGEHVDIHPADLGAVAEAFTEEADSVEDKQHFISFPPLGRIMFRYDFHLDAGIIDEIIDEEEDTHSKATDFGLSFMYTTNEKAGRKIKASMSFWEEFILLHASSDTHDINFSKLFATINAICLAIPPYIGAMNSEIHLNTDRSLDNLKSTGVPEGNDFVLLGKQITAQLDYTATEKKCGSIIKLANQSLLIKFTDKW